MSDPPNLNSGYPSTGENDFNSEYRSAAVGDNPPPIRYSTYFPTDTDGCSHTENYPKGYLQYSYKTLNSNAAYGQSSKPEGSTDPERGVDEDEDERFIFTEQSIRKAFIRKVYTILMIQLSVTSGFIALLVFCRPAQLWAWRHPEVFWVAIAVYFVTLIALACCEKVRRKSPMNYIFLGIFTIALSFLLAVGAARYEAVEVLMAVGITGVVCLALTLFALQTKLDFTVIGGVLLICLVVFFLFGIIAIFIPGTILRLVYASIGVLLFSFFLIYDTQLMLGGKHRYAISPEDYVFAALNLYIDMIQMFLFILQIIGLSRN